MRCINPRFTYLLTYLLYSSAWVKKHPNTVRHTLTDFNNAFAVALWDELQKKLEWNLPPRLKYVAALPCETRVFKCRHLRYAGLGDVVVPRTRTVGFGPRSFCVAGPSLWNTLPIDTKVASLTVSTFRNQLKTEMFLRSYFAPAQPS